MGHADALSRRPQRPCASTCKKCTKCELKEEKSVNWTAVQPQDDWDEETTKKEQILDEDIMPRGASLLKRVYTD